MMWARRRSLALVVVSYNCRSSMTWVSDKGGRVRGLAIVPFRKDGPHYITPSLYRKYFWKHLEEKSGMACGSVVGLGMPVVTDVEGRRCGPAKARSPPPSYQMRSMGQYTPRGKGRPCARAQVCVPHTINRSSVIAPVSHTTKRTGCIEES